MLFHLFSEAAPHWLGAAALSVTTCVHLSQAGIQMQKLILYSTSKPTSEVSALLLVNVILGSLCDYSFVESVKWFIIQVDKVKVSFIEPQTPIIYTSPLCYISHPLHHELSDGLNHTCSSLHQQKSSQIFIGLNYNDYSQPAPCSQLPQRGDH
jgi:hypothetical protein